MHNFVLPDHFEGIFKLEKDASHLFFRERSLVVLLDVFVQISVSTVLKHQIKIMSGLFKIKKTHDVGVFHQL